ncbi:unnamed protein product, partial [Urochloa humidicola]
PVPTPSSPLSLPRIPDSSLPSVSLPPLTSSRHPPNTHRWQRRRPWRREEPVLLLRGGNNQVTHAAMLDFARVYSFLGSIFDPDTSEHLQRLKAMDPIGVETVLLLMRNLSINLTSPDFEEHHERSSSVGHLCKQCEFIQFVNRTDAEEALQGPNGVTIGKQAVRLSRGRSLASKQGAYLHHIFSFLHAFLPI